METVDELREWIARRLRDLSARHPATHAGRYMSADEVVDWCKRTVGPHVDTVTVDSCLARLVTRGEVVKEAGVYSAAVPA